MLCESMPAAAQGQVLHVEMENDPRASAAQGQAQHGKCCDSQARQWDTSIKFLFHMDKLLVTCHGTVFHLPFCGLRGNQEKPI